jgi:hypothetical protein
MKTFNNNEELLRLVQEQNGIKYIDFNYEHIICPFDINLIDINIINAMNIDAGNINAKNINAKNINAWDIDAKNINAWDIDAENIDAGDIIYYAACFAYSSFKCKSVRGRRNNAKHFCLDSEIIYK